MKNSVLVSILAIASTCAAQFAAEQCGPKAGNQKCKQNKCCSQYGWCGTSTAYCLSNLGCQAGFGRCTGAVSSSRAISSSSVRSPVPAASPSAPAALISTNGRCGSSFGGQICKGSTFGDCCSQYNWCGTTTDHCRAAQGCQLAFGTCTGAQSSSISVSLSRTSSARSSSSLISSTRSQGSSSVSSRASSSSSRASSSSSRLSSASSSAASLTTFSTRTSQSSSSSSAIAASQSSQSSSSSPISASSSVLQSSSTSSARSSSSSSAQPSVSSSSSQPSASSFSSSIAPSSSSSSGASSSSAVISSSSEVISSSSAVASSSSAVASSSSAVAPSSSSLISSMITTSASPSLSLVSSTNSFVASSSASGSPTVSTRVLRAARNPAVVRTAPEHLVPKNALNFFFAEEGTSYTTSVQTNLDSGALGILLENIASLSSVTCSGSTIDLQFSDEASYNTARNWPVGTILFSLSDGCNTATERGVYRLTTATTFTSILPPPRLRARVTFTQTTNYWQLPLEALLIQMEAVVADYENLKRQAAETAAAASSPIPTPPTTLVSLEVTSTASLEVTSTISAVVVTSTASLEATSTITVVAVSSSSAVQPSASPSGLPACGGYAPGGRFDIDGTAYQISCTLAGTWRQIWIDISWQENFRACMVHCNTNTQCAVATFNEQQINNGKYMCQRWSILPYKTDNSVNSPMAVKIV